MTMACGDITGPRPPTRAAGRHTAGDAPASWGFRWRLRPQAAHIWACLKDLVPRCLFLCLLLVRMSPPVASGAGQHLLCPQPSTPVCSGRGLQALLAGMRVLGAGRMAGSALTSSAPGSWDRAPRPLAPWPLAGGSCQSCSGPGCTGSEGPQPPTL